MPFIFSSLETGGSCLGISVRMPSNVKQMISLLIFIVVVFTGAGIAGSVSASAMGPWYNSLIKPDWTPPDSWFGPVWSALYFMIAIAGWLAWKHSSGSGRQKAMLIYGVQLGLNFAWSFIFFGTRAIGAAFAEILLLWLVIVLTILYFYKLSRTAAWLLVPYVLWVSFAAFLNFHFWKLNMGV